MITDAGRTGDMTLLLFFIMTIWDNADYYRKINIFIKFCYKELNECSGLNWKKSGKKLFMPLLQPETM
jgi:hypothetical protein